jgi:hypothetical protein
MLGWLCRGRRIPEQTAGGRYRRRGHYYREGRQGLNDLRAEPVKESHRPLAPFSPPSGASGPVALAKHPVRTRWTFRLARFFLSGNRSRAAGCFCRAQTRVVLANSCLGVQFIVPRCGIARPHVRTPRKPIRLSPGTRRQPNPSVTGGPEKVFPACAFITVRGGFSRIPPSMSARNKPVSRVRIGFGLDPGPMPLDRDSAASRGDGAAPCKDPSSGECFT